VHAALESNRVQVVEGDTGVDVARTLEHTTDVWFRISDVRVQQLGAI